MLSEPLLSRRHDRQFHWQDLCKRISELRLAEKVRVPYCLWKLGRSQRSNADPHLFLLLLVIISICKAGNIEVTFVNL